MYVEINMIKICETIRNKFLYQSIILMHLCFPRKENVDFFKIFSMESLGARFSCQIASLIWLTYR